MKCKEIKKYLNDYIDGLLSADKVKIVDEHISECPKCRKEFNELTAIIEEAKLMPEEVTPPHDLWHNILQGIGSHTGGGATKIFKLENISPNGKHYRLRFRASRLYSGRRIVFAGSFAVAAVMIFILFSLMFNVNQKPASFWMVERLAGSPVVGNVKIATSGMLQPGEWIVTDASSRARLKMGKIGEVDIHPGSRVRLIKIKASEYRISLEKGMIDAKISAPPKLFFVETPSAIAIDLGCRYMLEVADNGSGYLHVLNGRVAFAFNGRESIVPAGAMCETRVSAGPGTPYYENASSELKAALSRIDFENGGEKEVDVVINKVNKLEAISLWHLLKRVDYKSKVKIYNKITVMFTVPSEITLEGITNGNKEMFDRLWKVMGIGKKAS